MVGELSEEANNGTKDLYIRSSCEALAEHMILQTYTATDQVAG
jgi:hypothetical protein